MVFSAGIRRRAGLLGALLAAAVVFCAASAVYVLPQVKRLMSSITIPMKNLPARMGSHGNGRLTLTVPATAGSAERPIMLDVWYPAAADAGQPMGDLSLAPIADSRKRFALVLYAPGWGGKGASNALLLGELARAGYVIAVMDDVGATPDLGSDAAADFDVASAQALRTSLALANRRLEAMVERATRSLDYLLAIDTDQPAHMLAGRLDARKVGMLGFSFGGAVAAEMSRRDQRIRATVNFDGWLFGRAASEGARPPYLVINSDFPNLAAAATSFSTGRRNMAQLTVLDRQIQRRQSCLDGFYALYYDDIDHGDLTDQLFAPDLLNYLKFWRRTDTQRQEIFASVRAYTFDFLDAHLLDARPPALLNRSASPYAFVHRLDPESPPQAGVPCTKQSP